MRAAVKMLNNISGICAVSFSVYTINDLLGIIISTGGANLLILFVVAEICKS